MRLHRLASIALGACLVALSTSCGGGGDAGSPTGAETGAPGTDTRTDGVLLVLVSGGGQTGVAGLPLADPIVVRVLSTENEPVAGATIEFIPSEGSADPRLAQTDALGFARTTWTLGSSLHQELRVSGTGGTLLVGADAVVRVARVRVTPDALVLLSGAMGDLDAVALDSAGNVLTGRAVAWTSGDSAVASVGADGGVSARSLGATHVMATVEGVSGLAAVRVEAPPARVARVEVRPDSLVLDAGATGDLDAVAYDSAGDVLTGRAVSWASSEPAVAAVGAAGRVTGVAAGTARVTASVEGVSASAGVRVRAPAGGRVAAVRLVPEVLMLRVGATGDFTAVALDSAGGVLTGRAVAWSSADSSIATVSAEGRVRAIAPGVVRVSATVEGVRGSAAVHVLPPQGARVARVEVTPDSLVLDPGQSGDFDAVAYDSAGNVLTGRPVRWSAADSAVVFVGANGTVTAVAPGTARVLATVEGVSGSGAVRVRDPAPAAVARVALTPDSLVLALGQTERFTATAYDASGHVLTGRMVAWSSSDGTVAVAGTGGAVTAVGAGTARVTATVEGVAGSASVRVWAQGPPKVARVRVQPDSLVMDIGDSAEVRVLAYDSVGNYLTGRGVTFTSTATGVATVGANGQVVAVGAGSARIDATVEGVTGSATVRVREKPAGVVTRVRIVPDSLILYIAESRDIVAVAYDSDGRALTGRRVTWTSSDPSVAPIYEGTATGVKAGFARLTATVEGVSYSIKVEVRGPPPQPYGSRPVMWIQKRVGSPSVGPDYGLIDVTDYERSVDFYVQLGHTASAITLRVRSPGGTLQSCANPERWTNDGKEFHCVVYLPKGSEPGAWTVDRLTVDNVTYTSADLAAMGAPGRVFDVFRKGADGAPPQIRSLWVHGWASGFYYVEIGIADHGSGVHSAALVVSGPQGQTVSCSARGSSGDLARLGTWVCPLAVPPNSGTWKVVSVTTSDGAGNSATYTPAQIDVVRDAFEYTWLTYEFFP